MTPVILISLILILFSLELAYFKIAEHYKIIDIPNKRSSHLDRTIRGGGIIFILAAAIHYLFFGFDYSYFMTGLLIVATISFVDDIITLNNKLRLAMHVLAVALLFSQWHLYHFPWYYCILIAVFVLASINAYNFMDGINGITGAYSLIAIATLYYINELVYSFIAPEFLILIALGLITFNFFNFRKKAKCFAGDVGSVSIAYTIVFIIGVLIIKTGNPAYILLLVWYGLDAVTTIIFRLFRRENIFEAHRSHFYQYLANEKQLPHLLVATGYAMFQLITNIILIKFDLDLKMTAGMLLASSLGFISLRFYLEGSERLLKASVKHTGN